MGQAEAKEKQEAATAVKNEIKENLKQQVLSKEEKPKEADEITVAIEEEKTAQKTEDEATEEAEKAGKEVKDLEENIKENLKEQNNAKTRSLLSKAEDDMDKAKT